MSAGKIEFQPLGLYRENEDDDDNIENPFVLTARVEESHGNQIYSCAFNPYLPEGSNQILVTVSNRYAHIYELPLKNNGMRLIGAFECSSVTESLFSSAWCYDTYEASMKRNPYMITFGGENGIIYVVDTARMQLVNRLTSHGSTINEIRTHPTDSDIIASCSKDKTIRIFHIRNDGCLFVIGSHSAHSDQILSLDWSFDGSYIVSCGMDHSIFKWDLSDDRCQKIFEASHVKTRADERNILDVSAIDIMQSVRRRSYRERTIDRSTPRARDKGKKNTIENLQNLIDTESKKIDETTYISVNTPVAKIVDLHADYVDCIRIFGSSDYIFSKGCGQESVIFMSRFGSFDKSYCNPAGMEPDTSALKLSEKFVPIGQSWFVKFEIDPRNKWLVLPDMGGNLLLYWLKDIAEKKPRCTINVADGVLRQVAFGSCGRIMAAVSDDGAVLRLDRVSAKVVNIPQFKIRKMPIKILSHSYTCVADSSDPNAEKPTILNVRYLYKDQEFFEKFTMHKDQYLKLIKQDLYSKVAENLKVKHAGA